MFETEKIIQLKEEIIISLTNDNLEKKNKLKELEKKRDTFKEENKALTWKGMYFDIFKIWRC